MARMTSPLFRLFAGQLNTAFQNGQAAKVFDTLLPEFGLKPPEQGYGVPVALRWTSEPSFAFARQPFKVYRRRQKYPAQTILGSSRNVSGAFTITSPGGEMYRAEINLTLAAGQQLRIQAIDRNGNDIPFTAIDATATGRYILRAPFTHRIRFNGTGTIDRILGTLQSEMVNLPDWELIQLVGFPFKSGQIAAPQYDPEPQGWPAGLLTDGRNFAFIRLLLGQALHEAMPALPNPSLPIPIWNAPDPNSYLFDLADTAESLLPLIQDCLMNTDDASPNPQDRQPAYIAVRTVDGLRQDGFPGTVQPGDAMIPVVSTTLLAAATDNYASLGLGYGTYDFPPGFQDNPEEEGGFDYMVTNTYLVRPPELELFPFEFAYPVEFAALAEYRPRPDTPSLISVSGQHQNRPLVRDMPTDEAMQLQFAAPPFPQGYGIIKGDSSLQVDILNNERRFNPDSYDPHIPNIPNAENVGTASCIFTEPFSPIPLRDTEVYAYYLAAIDVFGRWSGYDQRNYIARALPPQRPGLKSVKLSEKQPLPAGSPPDIPCTLEIEFSWDWTERTPAIIQFGGGFYPADAAASPMFFDRFAEHSSNAVLPLIEVTFAADGSPLTSGSGHSVHQIIPNDPGADPNLRQYKLIVDPVTATFPGPLVHPATPPAIDPSQVAYSVTARALELVRAPAPAGPWSDWVAPVTSTLDDPRPPVMVSLPATINWTALPDATNTARGRLNWPAIPRAAGYVVWQAAETALREFLGLAHRPDDTYVDRATELSTYLSNPAHEMESLKAFVRLNKELIRTTSTEVSLPGAADTLFIYRVSAMSTSNMESSRSNAVFFAVPRQITPGQPQLKLKVIQNGSGSGIEVMALKGAGPDPAGYRVYRVRKALGSNVVQMKGLPIIEHDHPNWTPYQLQHRDGAASEGQKILNTITELSWKPYYYQITAVGPQDLTQGVVRGESAGSPTAVAYFPPTTPPVLTLVSHTRNATVRLVVFNSNIPLDVLTIGSATIEVMRYEASGGGIPKREMLLSGEVPKLPTTDIPISLTTTPLPALPHIAVEPATQQFYLRLDPAIETGIIKVRDPLGRSSEVLFSTAP